MIPHSKPWITSSDKKAVHEVLTSGMIAQGSLAELFEERVSIYCGYTFALATPTGTAALALILRALDIGVGDEVILPTYVCKSVADAVIFTGATPVMCDTSGSWCMVPADVQRVMTRNTKAVVLVHMFGIDASATEFAELGIPVIDDFCQAFGLKPLHNNPSGLAFCSFNATKCLATGEGGMALVNDGILFERLRALKLKNQPLARYSDFQSALGLSQLARYPEMLRKRKVIAERYFRELDEAIVQNSSELNICLSRDIVGRKSIFFRFPIKLTGHPLSHIAVIERDYGIALRRGVDALLHDTAQQELPSAEQLFDNTLSIPLYPALTEKEVSHIIKSLNRYIAA